MQQSPLSTIGSPIEQTTRAGYDIQISTAKRFKRNEEDSLQNAIKHSTYSKKTAKGCLYFRPVGKTDGKMKFADGISIRGAENLYCNWGNVRIGAQISGVVDGKLIVRGICHDLETNVWVEKEASKNVTKRSGEVYSDNQISVTAGALSSIAIRNAFMSNFPGYAKERFLDEIKAKIAGGSQDEINQNWKEAKAIFNKDFGLKEPHLRGILEIDKDAEISADHIVFLTGIYNGLKDRIFPIEDAFGTKTKPHKKNKKTETKPEKEVNKEPDKTETADTEQTVGQKFNTLHLQMAKKFPPDEVDAFLKNFQGKFNTLITNFTDEHKSEIIPEMEKMINGLK